MYKKESPEKIIKVILGSISKGASINSACNAGGIDPGTFWLWRKKNKELDSEVKTLYDSRIQIVEDALYKQALSGNVTAQIFFLKNRAVDRWRDKTDIEHLLSESTIDKFASLSATELLNKAYDLIGKPDKPK